MEIYKLDKNIKIRGDNFPFLCYIIFEEAEYGKATIYLFLIYYMAVQTMNYIENSC